MPQPLSSQRNLLPVTLVAGSFRSAVHGSRWQEEKDARTAGASITKTAQLASVSIGAVIKLTSAFRSMGKTLVNGYILLHVMFQRKKGLSGSFLFSNVIKCCIHTILPTGAAHTFSQTASNVANLYGSPHSPLRNYDISDSEGIDGTGAIHYARFTDT